MNEPRRRYPNASGAGDGKEGETMRLTTCVEPLCGSQVRSGPWGRAMNVAVRAALLSGGLPVMLSVFVHPACAQDAQAGETGKSEDIVVTASRITRSGFTAPTPTTMLDADNVALQGASTLTEAVNQIPSFLPNTTPATAGNSTATAGANFLNLRGIGAPRTLVLVNGRRFVPSATQAAIAGTVDVNLIPQALIDRVEVVTGGASAAWGSDAVAGVVNFILDRDQKGLEVGLQAGISSRGDNAETQVSARWGTDLADGRGHFVISGEYFDSRGILNQQDRKWGAEGWQVFVNPLYTPTNGEPARILSADVHQSNRTEGGLILTAGPLRYLQFGPGGTVSPFATGSYLGSTYMVGGDGINQGKYISLVTPHRRRSLYAMFDYDIADNVRLSLEGSYARSTSNNETTASFSLAPYTITQQNAFLPDAVRSTMLTNGITQFQMGRINTDFGYITTDLDAKVYRAVASLDGNFGDTWRWSAYYTYGETRRLDRSLGNVVNARLAAAIDSIADPVTGQPVCRNLATNPGCVPINLFGYGSPSAAAIDYVTEDQVVASKIRQHAAALDFSGEPFSTWAGAVSLAFGIEYRRESVSSVADAISLANGFMIGNPKSLAGHYDVKEAYAEAVVPLLRDVPFARLLELNGAVRYTDYSTGASVTTWKLGGTYVPMDGLKLRGTLSRDIRAANLTEMFSISGLSFANVRDPRDGSSPFISSLSAGNPGLAPEKADTWTAGVVLEPVMLPGLRLSVDYYDIDISGAIGTLTTQNIIDRCFIGGAAQLCDLIELNPDTSIRHVNNFFVNIQTVQTRGVDAELAYRTALGSDSLSVRLLGTYVADLVTGDGVTSVDRAGQAQGTGVPHWTGLANIVYATGPLSLGVSGRYVGGGAFDVTFGPGDINDNSISGRFYINLSAQYDIGRGDGWTMELYGAVKNLLDKDPPIVGSTFQAPFATNGALYDMVGRYFTVGARVRF